MAADAWLELDVVLPVGDRALAVKPTATRLGIVGPSGTGKSTLLRAIAGVERRVRGRIACGGETWQDASTFVPPWKRGIGWVAQDARLFPHRTVADNLAWRAEAKIADHARTLGIDALLDRMPRNLSGGERQRVALVRAVASATRLLVLDEPFSALDRPLRERTISWLAEQDVPVVVVSHDERDLAGLGVEIIAL